MTEPDTYRKHKWLFADRMRHPNCLLSTMVPDPEMEPEPTDEGWTYTCPECGVTVAVRVTR